MIAILLDENILDRLRIARLYSYYDEENINLNIKDRVLLKMIPIR